jgi:hypothetical protein
MEPREVDDSAEEAIRPLVPSGVLRGIQDINNGNTASLDDLKDASKF